MPSGSTKADRPLNGHEVVVHVRLPAEVNKGLATIHALQEPSGDKTEFAARPKKEVGMRLRVSPAMHWSLVNLQSRRAMRTKQWVTRNRLIVDIVRERIAAVLKKIEAAKTPRAKERLRAKLREDLYDPSPRAKISRNAMIVRMIQDSIEGMEPPRKRRGV